MPGDRATEQKKLLVTGFGPFGEFAVNPSTVVVERLRNKYLGSNCANYAIEYEIVPCTYREALNVCRDLKVDFSIHIGVNGDSRSVNLETTSFGHGYSRVDVAENLPHLNCCDYTKCGATPEALPSKLCTVLDLAAVRDSVRNSSSLVFKDVEISDNPGSYLCAFIYYNAMLHNDNRSLFIHIPDFDETAATTPDAVAQCVAVVISAVIAQISQ